MAELKIYSGGPDETDQAKTEELKRFSEQAPVSPDASRDHAEAVMERASAEIARRTKKAMLYSNLDYFTASQRVVQADSELGELYIRGYIK